MTVTELIEKLRLVEETGKGNLEVLFQDAKEGYGWGFPHIDKNADGKVTAAEYEAFQKYKRKVYYWPLR